MKQALILVLLGCYMVGCSGVGSVYPIYTPDNMVALSGVLGTWIVKDKEDLVVISSGEHGSFKLRFREDDGTLNTFDVHLTRIGGALFADLFSQGGSKDAPLSMPVHLFAKVEFAEGALRLFLPNAKWVETRLDQRPSVIHHIKAYAKGEEGWIYLTDGTRQVRSFLKKCATSPEAFVEDKELTLGKVSDSQDLPPAKPEAGDKTEQNPSK